MTPLDLVFARVVRIRRLSDLAVPLPYPCGGTATFHSNPSGWPGWRRALKWIAGLLRDWHRSRARRLVRKAERRARADGWGLAVERLTDRVKRHRIKARRWDTRYSGGR